MPSSSRVKCYFGCVCDGPLHRFPKPEYPYLEKFELWKNVLDINVQLKGNKYIYNQIRICNKHFERCFISTSNRLTSTAVPTLFLMEHQQTIEPIQAVEPMEVELITQPVSTSPSQPTLEHKILPAECEDTADLLLIFDKLFDSFNGHSYSDSAKILKGCVKSNSPHFKYWSEVLPILESMVFLTKKNQNMIEIVKFEKIPSLQNWIHNIKTFKEMWGYLQKYHPINNILPRNFNQDPLENFFSCIRSNGIRNINPTCYQFINAYKTLLIVRKIIISHYNRSNL